MADTDKVGLFCRHVGVGFQILNDLKDWQGDLDNKLRSGQDALALRPTLLLALALKVASDEQKQLLRDVFEGRLDDISEEARLHKIRTVFDDCDVFSKAETLVERSQERAEAIIEDVDDEHVQSLLRFFLETVLARDEGPTPAEHLDPDSGDPPPKPDPKPVMVQLGIGV